MKQKGFTLLEMVVAFAIFALLATMVWIANVTAMQNSELAKQQLERLGKIQLAFVIMGRAIGQISDRRIRDAYGDTLPALIVQDGLDSAIEFSATGRIPQGLPGPNISRTGFGVDEEKLWRYNWPVLDRAQDSQPSKSLLLQDVSNIEMRYLDNKSAWHQQWPVDPFNEKLKFQLPRAVELTLETKDWGKLIRIFILAEYD